MPETSEACYVRIAASAGSDSRLAYRTRSDEWDVFPPGLTVAQVRPLTPLTEVDPPGRVTDRRRGPDRDAAGRSDRRRREAAHHPARITQRRGSSLTLREDHLARLPDEVLDDDLCFVVERFVASSGGVAVGRALAGAPTARPEQPPTPSRLLNQARNRRTA